MEPIRILRHADNDLTPTIIRALEERFSGFEFNAGGDSIWVGGCPAEKAELVRAFAAGCLYTARVLKTK